MKHFSRTERHLAAVTLSVVVGGCVYAGLLMLIDYNKRHIADTGATIREAEARENAAHKLTTLLSDTAQERTQLAGYFLDVKRLPDFLALLDEVATTSSVSLEVLSVAEEPIAVAKTTSAAKKKTPATPVKNRFTLSISFEGSWADVMQFFALLEHLPYALSIEQADVEWVERSKDTGPHWRGLATLHVDEPY